MRFIHPTHLASALLGPALLVACSGQTTPVPVPPAPAPYFGQSLPGETPLPFATDRLASLGPTVVATEFSPDGSMFFGVTAATATSAQKLHLSRYVNGAWTRFEQAPFLTDFIMSHEPVFSADGRTLTFTGKKADGNVDLWTVTHAEGSWGIPVRMPAPINSETRDFRGSYAKDGSYYFCSWRLNPAQGLMQIFRASRDASQNWTVEPLPAPINNQSYEGDPCIAPDGRFLVFYSARDGKSADLYVVFRNAQGAWGNPVLLGPEFNTPADEFGAHLSADGEFLFFTRRSAATCQILWVRTSAIDKLKP